MPQSICPYLMRWQGSQQRAAPIDYPSFENHCPALGDEIPLLLADQATFCLSGSHRYCQRYTALGTEQQKTAQQDPEAQPLEMLEIAQEPLWRAAATAPDEAADLPWPTVQQQPQVIRPGSAWAGAHWWTWAGAGLFFITVLLIGSLYAAYTGWQLALANLADARAGRVNTLANGDMPPTPYVVFVTASAPVAVESPATQPTAAPVAAVAQAAPGNFPAAVTATPVIVVPLPANGAAGNGTSQNSNQAVLIATTVPAGMTPAAPSNIQLPPADVVATPVINVFLPLPTQRSTPIFDIPTSTPAVEEPTPTPTQTPLPPILGTPVIVFAPDNSVVAPGKCTQVRWHVENVREVYYESLPSFGDGSREECIDDELETYALTVVFATGQTKIYTTTVGVLWPTETPEPTPSFTPEIEPTQTWTPLPPTALPTPAVVYGVTLTANGTNPHSCPAGAVCEIGLVASNAGDSADNVSVELLQTGNWSALICRQDGVCAQSKLTLSTVGPGNTALINLRIEIPAEAAGQTSNDYTLRAVSEGSGGQIVSQVVYIKIAVP